MLTACTRRDIVQGVCRLAHMMKEWRNVTRESLHRCDARTDGWGYLYVRPQRLGTA
jgi:hypothetical protein